MPPLQTKTIRIRLDQESTLSSAEYKGSVGFLFRDLLDIFLKSELPGAEIMKLRKKIKETNNEMSGL
jgi:hypothetical protein